MTADFTHLKAIGIPAYINEQFNTAPQFVDSTTDPKFALSSDYTFQPSYPQFAAASCDTTCTRDFYSMYQVQKQFMLNALTQNDQLRQRVGFAFHKFIVVGSQQLNNNQPFWYAPYLQTIDRNSFGQLPQHAHGSHAESGHGRIPEHARKLGDRSQQPDAERELRARDHATVFDRGGHFESGWNPGPRCQGNRVASYDQIRSLIWRVSLLVGILMRTKVSPFDGTTSSLNYQDPMVPNGNRNRYDIAQKTLLVDTRSPNPLVVPACSNCTTGTTAQQTANTQAYAVSSLGLAIDNLFYHANTGPYLCTQLIHQLVTSNPSPAYVGRCAAAFANNGSGVRGDMKAVITSILLDPEARGDVKTDPNYGHLREPVLLMTHLLRAFNATDSSKTDGVLVSNSPQNFSNALGQNVFNPPTVFSYFPADYNLPGTSLVGPEFGILDTSSTYARSNFINTLFLTNGGNGIPVSAPNRPQGTQISFASFQALSTTPQQLVDALNARLMHGTMSSQMNASIVAQVTAITNANATTQALQRTQTAIYLVATSSQYQVER
jgi:hypothetical protein